MDYSHLYARLYAQRQKALTAGAAVWHFYPSRFYFLAILLAQVLAWFQASFIFRNLSGELLVLHYNVDFGVDLVGLPAQIFFYPLFGLVVFLLNLVIAASLHRHKNFRTFVHLLLGAAVTFALFLNLTFWFIYLINFR
jgi:hypothetical protein